MSAPTLTDGTVLLDGHTLADLGPHLAGEDEEQARRFGWFPARSTEETVKRAIAEWQAAWASGGSVRAFAVREVAGGALVGGCELRLRGDGRAEASYWTFPPFRGRGYASRALRLLTRCAVADLAVERIELQIEPDNYPSRRVARQAGFTEEAVLRHGAKTASGRVDMVVYSLLPADVASPREEH